MSSHIHPSAVIDPSAIIEDDVVIGPWTVVGARSVIGRRTRLDAHVVIGSDTILGEDNHIYSFAAVGGDTQDKKVEASEGRLEMGDRNRVREYVTINRGKDVTRVGSDNFFLACSHVAHDCVVGDHNVMVNYSALSGHVVMENHVTLSGYAGVHQFCRIGSHSFIVRATLVTKDVLPFLLVGGGHSARVYGLNLEGLRRRGFSSEDLAGLKRAYRIIFRSRLPLQQICFELETLLPEIPHIRSFLEAIALSQRGFLR